MLSRRQQRGLELLSIYNRAKRLGINVSGNESMKLEQNFIHHVLHDWRRIQEEEKVQLDDHKNANIGTVHESIGNVHESIGTVHESIGTVHECAIHGNVHENIGIELHATVATKEENFLEEKNIENFEYFELLLQLAEQKQINRQLQQRFQDLERMNQCFVPKSAFALPKENSTLLLRREELSISGNMSAETPSELSEAAVIPASSIGRSECRFQLSQNSIDLLLKENERLRKLLERPSKP